MNSTRKNSNPLSEPYRKTIGKVTFQVSAFGNPSGTETAQKMMLHLMERNAAECNLHIEEEGESA